MVYTDTFILIAPDSPITESIMPVAKGDKKTIHLIQYELLAQRPYELTHEDLVYEVYVRQKGLSEDELAARGAEIRAELLAKEHPCLRASALTKKYGWGAHYNHEGKIALYPVESGEYQQFCEDGATKLLKAMRSKRE
jgi:hypothetical protein